MRRQRDNPIVQLLLILIAVAGLDYLFPHANVIPIAGLFLGAAGFVNSTHRDH